MNLSTSFATFFSDGRLDTVAAFALAGVIGVSFGFWLERAGFGSSRRLAGVFYGRDFAVIQVMFSDEAICPYCGSTDTAHKNSFGPTLCRALYYCRHCQQ